ncbi:hypothetical protein [Hymenobacter baengnokdamensis]|uniref:hypothetical protein n=1 Tax=Hymenobacter baengnokdamensis TaxID=2615203 RepID=UPI001245B3AF|nr:hypothetical protein [Hymenobacter baengnokdamensis]
MQLIALADVLLLMDTTSDPFTVVYSTADRQRGTGGELLTLEGCVCTGGKPKPKAPAPAEPVKWTVVAGLALGRRPGHRVNQTRNVTVLSSGKTRKLHVRLIVEFNGQTVHW